MDAEWLPFGERLNGYGDILSGIQLLVDRHPSIYIDGQYSFGSRLQPWALRSGFCMGGATPGGLASASVLGCAAFSAVSGSSVATAVTIGRVALPEMARFNYSSGLATGAIAAGGTLGFLIPPSTGFVIYAILTEQSIGQLFMSGILPGLLLAGLFILTVTLISLRNPEADRAELMFR